MVAFDCGADAYLTKPISLKYLRKRIDQLLARVESAEMVNSVTTSIFSFTDFGTIMISSSEETGSSTPY